MPTGVSYLTVAQTLMASTMRLYGGSAPPDQVARDVAASLQLFDPGDCNSARHRIPSALALQPGGAGIAGTPPTIEELVSALRDVSYDLSQRAPQGREQRALRTLGTVLETLLHRGREQHPLDRSPSVLRWQTPANDSVDLIDSGTAAAMIDAAARVTHDANNNLFAVSAEVSDMCFALDSFDLASIDIRTKIPELRLPLQSFIDHFRDFQTYMESLFEETVKAIRRIQDRFRNFRILSALDQKRIAEELYLDGRDFKDVVRKLASLRRIMRAASVQLKEIQTAFEKYGHQMTPQNVESFAEAHKHLGERLNISADLIELTRSMFVSISESSTGTAHVDRDVVDLHRYANPALLRSLLGKELKANFLLDTDPWPVTGPGLSLWKIILNIVVNAREAMKGEGRFCLTTRKAVIDEDSIDFFDAPLIRGAVRPGEFMVVQIRDNGPGIPETILDRIFEKSFSGKGSSGLGLAVTLAEVEALDGFITVSTSVDANDHGTTFSIYLPRIRP